MEGWSQWATSLGCHVSRVPPHWDGVTSHFRGHRSEASSMLRHGLGAQRGRPTCRWVSGWAHFRCAGAPCPLSLPAVPDRPATLRTTTGLRGVLRMTPRPSGLRWTREGPPSSQAAITQGRDQHPVRLPAHRHLVGMGGSRRGSESHSEPSGGFSRGPTHSLVVACQLPESR